MGSLLDAWRERPLWARWVLTLVGFAVVGTIAVIVFTNENGKDDGPQPESPAEVREANRESQLVVEQDQAPHTVRLAVGASAQAALTRAIADNMRARIARREIDGPMEGARCAPSGSGESATTQGFRCTVTAAHVGYPFAGVVDHRTGAITWCKRDPAPSAQTAVPLSPRCDA